MVVGREAEVAEIADRYAGLSVVMADASLVALAGALETTMIATFDERHFRAIRPLSDGDAFRLLPPMPHSVQALTAHKVEPALVAWLR